jgi:hypothetical protein
MSKATWPLALASLLALPVLTGIAAAQAAPAVVSAPATPSAACPPAPDLDLAQIFAPPAASGAALTPEPAWTSCTMTQCKQPCRQECIDSFCTPVCINPSTCLCGCSCP